MSGSIAKSLADAIIELKSKPLVKEVYLIETPNKQLPGKWVERVLAVLHKLPNKEGYTWSSKIIYIKDETPYEYLFHYSGAVEEKAASPTRDFFLSKLAAIKAAKNFDFIEIEAVNEESKSVIIYAIKEDTNKNGIIYRAKCWKTGIDTFDYLLI